MSWAASNRAKDTLAMIDYFCGPGRSEIKERCRKWFERCDVNGDGVLEHAEVKCTLNAIFKDLSMDPPSAAKLEALFTRCDENGDGVLSLDEWSRFYNFIIQSAVAHAQRTIDRLAQVEQLREREQEQKRREAREREQEQKRREAREREQEQKRAAQKPIDLKVVVKTEGKRSKQLTIRNVTPEVSAEELRKMIHTRTCIAPSRQSFWYGGKTRGDNSCELYEWLDHWDEIPLNHWEYFCHGHALTVKDTATTVGTKLATRVANKLASGKVMTYVHRDYCGIGLKFDGGKYVMGEFYDGYLYRNGRDQSWSTKGEFVTWLAAQSDHTFGNPGNQRITLERLAADAAFVAAPAS